MSANGPEPKVYTPWEAAQIALVLARMARVGRPTAKLDRQLEAIKARGVAREAMAAEVARLRKEERVKAKAARRS